MNSGRHRETISRTVEVRYSHKKQVRGGGEYALVKLRLEPLPRGAGIQFVNAVKGDVVPASWVGGVEEGIRKAAAAGILSGGPVEDVRVTLLDGAYHERDSSWHSFSLAAQKAFLNGMRDAGPKYLLP